MKEQLLHLESLFGENNCPDLFKREEIAVELNIKEKNIHVSLDYIYIYIYITKLKCGKYIFFCFHTELVPK